MSAGVTPTLPVSQQPRTEHVTPVGNSETTAKAASRGQGIPPVAEAGEAGDSDTFFKRRPKQRHFAIG